MAVATCRRQKSHERALATRLKKLGSKHVDMANSYNNLGTVYDNLVTCNVYKYVMIVQCYMSQKARIWECGCGKAKERLDRAVGGYDKALSILSPMSFHLFAFV